MDELLADFVAETREMLEAMGGELVAWEAEPSDGARLDAIFRFVHTVKGNCGFFDFPRLEHLSHAAEDALAECRAGRRESDRTLVTAVLAIIDRIGEMANAIEAGEDFLEGGGDLLIAALTPGGADEAMEPVAADVAASSIGDEAEEGQATKAGKASLQRTIRLPVSLLDEVMKGVSDMVLARNDLARRLREAGEQPAIDGPFERLSAILADVRTAITRMRMQRLEVLFGSLPRLVRDLSAELGKQVMVDFEGGDVELDREMVDMIRDPLTHIVRNAIDHGIESPEQRIRAGKPATGTLRISAQQAGNQIVIEIADDGAGIDGDKLLRKAIANGLLSAEQGERLSPAQRTALIFEAGLTTADAVTAISGRGVGMDVVRSNIASLGGAVEVASVAGQGVRFTVRLPLTLAILDGLSVQVGAHVYILPLVNIAESIRLRVDQVSRLAGGAEVFALRSEYLPLIRLYELFHVTPRSTDLSQGSVVVIDIDGKRAGIYVDELLGQQQVVIKNLEAHYRRVDGISAATILGDGTVAMILDVSGLIRLAHVTNEVAGFRADSTAALSGRRDGAAFANDLSIPQ